ncbi:SAM-dependent methyltransferase, partial [Escherichia coli]|nr:SAM-dependent methyltransferase [Escherichia coli]
LNELVYHGQRGHVLDYLTRDGWQTSALTVTQLYEANGFAYPDDELATAFADLTYSSATLMR